MEIKRKLKKQFSLSDKIDFNIKTITRENKKNTT